MCVDKNLKQAVKLHNKLTMPLPAVYDDVSRRSLFLQRMVSVGRGDAEIEPGNGGVIKQTCFEVASLYLEVPNSVSLQSVSSEFSLVLLMICCNILTPA
jgi:hypothetical protein